VDENYKHIVRTCYKCGTVLEPQIKNQWFVSMKPLAEKAMEKIESGEITYLPDYYKKISLHWLQKINDWNISRQIVWGIPIPAKLCDSCGAGFVDLDNTMTKCSKCGGILRKDPDTFDTWFSSGQWPFASLGYPDNKDFKSFYPTDVLETAGDIIFFWVTRMIMLGLYTTGKAPFKTVYLHGLILDGKGQKMSKSKGNVIQPLDITAKFGTDALRMAIVVGNTPGTSLALSEDKVKGYKHFANKIWNIARFILEKNPTTKKPTLESSDQLLIDEFEEVTRDITMDMENFRFYLGAEKIYHYMWHRFADEIIESAKPKLRDGADKKVMASTQWTLFHILENSLVVLHPFMPFITEEIWSMLPDRENMLIIENWPDKK
jgi:valyl-tRNA synthetase